MVRTFVLLLLTALFSTHLQAQVAPASSRPFTTYAYGAASGAEHELNFGHALGATGGVFLQRSQWLGLDLRGVILTARVPLHTYIGEAGPRVAPRFGPVRPYAELLGGLGHSGYLQPPNNVLLGGFGAAWTYAFGTDLRITHRFQWRVAEYSHSHIYAGTGASPTILSTGIVFRIF